MRKIIIIIFVFAAAAGAAFAEDAPKDPKALFTKANSLYEAKDYAGAMEAYISILDLGVESGNLYYNLGNAFFKSGKIGYAILCYDRANRIKPRDSDIKSNLEYARSLVDDPGYTALPDNVIFKFLRLPYRPFGLNRLTKTTAALYIITVLLFSAGILNRKFGRRTRYVTALVTILFISSLAAFALRYYDESFLRHGIIVERSAECKYEPIDKSTTYFKVGEGCDVLVLQTRDDWRKIMRPDGKKGWVKKDAVEPI